MSKSLTGSIIICTRNFAQSLARTLTALAEVDVPDGEAYELIVVDNGSTDSTRVVVNSFSSSVFAHIAYILEPRVGQSHARNSGIAAARGEVVIFTDDDVIPDRAWLTRLTRPLLAATADAATGTIRLASHLERPWLTALHRRWLATQDSVDACSIELVGANMAFHTKVLARVPAFDTELGPGALGFGDDTLFSDQLRVAGYRIVWVPDAIVDHHPHPNRLHRTQWLSAARRRGATQAYLAHHWRHEAVADSRLRSAFFWSKLWLRRILQFHQVTRREGCPLWEISYVANLGMIEHYRQLRNQPRKYTRHGLAKISDGSSVAQGGAGSCH